MRILILASAALALVAAAPAYAAAKAAAPAANATAPAEKTKAAPKYDCTKKGNANKAACKTAAAAPAATPATPAKPAAAPTPAAKSPAAPAAAATKGESKMKTCATQWKAMTDAQKTDYKTKGAGMKSKAGKPLSGYNAFTSECMKK